jgi:NADH dehydrogenase [ubiquinone] 1 alpha subcomplex assembly factor 5
MSDEAALVFDPRAVLLHRRRAAPGLAAHDFLFREAADRLADRLDDIRRTFPVAAEIGSRGAVLRPGLKGVERLVRLDRLPAGSDAAFDGEALPLAHDGFDLVLSCLDLHWTNDLPGLLVQANAALKPDGLFLASLLGGGTLAELRECLLAAELEVQGGAGPRVSPFVDLRDAAGLLQRAGFALPVADAETITVTYPDMFALMRDLRGMGEANAVRLRRRTFTRRGTLFRAAQLYAERFGAPEGRIRATFEIVTLTGWRPAANQQKPLRRGSAQTRLADALGSVEHPAGDKTRG